MKANMLQWGGGFFALAGILWLLEGPVLGELAGVLSPLALLIGGISILLYKAP